MTLIQVNDICNAGCPYCGINRRGSTATKALTETIAGARNLSNEVTFGGGEPTLDPRLPALLLQARNQGIERTQVETNGLRFADSDYVKIITESGLTRARVMIPASDEETWTKVTRLEGRLELAWSGAANLLDAGVEVSLIVPVSTGNLDTVQSIVRRVAADLPGITSLQLRPVFFSPAPSGREVSPEVLELAQKHVVPIPLLASALMQGVAIGEETGIKVELDLQGGLPLCSLRRSPSALSAVTERRTNYKYGPNCGDCAMLERCSGMNALTESVHGPYETRPFHRIPPALTRNKNPEPVLIFSQGMPSYRFGPGEKAEIRVVMPCNQDCGFCFVNREAPNASLLELEQAVDLAIERDVGAVVFTGGEPTLSRHLSVLLDQAKRGGIPCRGIQTNALRLAQRELAERLVQAGMNHAHVSLHSVDPAEYLAITGFGTPTQAAEGLRNLAELGVELSVSLVICQANAESMPETVQYIHQNAPEARVVLAVAREQQGLDRPWEGTLIRGAKAALAIAEALFEAERLGLSMDIAGTCCVPPCVLGEDVLRKFGSLFLMGHREANWQKRSEGEEQIVNTVSNDFATTCDTCVLKDRCPGITRAYLERHGGAEFHPFDAIRASSLGLIELESRS